MRPLLRGLGAFLVLGGLAACSGTTGGVQSSPPVVMPQGAVGTLAAPSSNVSASVERTQSATADATTDNYTAPFENFVSPSEIILEPQGPCEHITATLAPGSAWPSFMKTLPAGTVITLYGTPSYQNEWSRQHGCPTGGFSTTKVVRGDPSPSPSPSGAPTPTPTPGDGGLPFGQLPANYDPPANWHPYQPTSPWNQELSNPDSPRLDPNDSTKIQALFNSAFGPNQYQGRIGTPLANLLSSGSTTAAFPYYFAKTSDPSVIINCTANYGTCEMQGKHYNVPAAAMPANDSDHHMIVIQPNGTELDVWEWGNGGSQQPPWKTNETVNVGWGGIANVTTGTGWDLGTNGMTAAGNDGLAGIIREPEIASGVIDHALTADIYCSPTTTPVYPALHSSDDTNCNGFQMSPNQIVATGNRLWIDMTDRQINALNLNNAQKTVLHALHDYGAFVIDYNNYDPISFGGLESQLPGYLYGDDIVSTWADRNLPFWFNASGVNWYDFLTSSDMNTLIQPHLHVLDPCVNNGYPGGKC
jgi:hypothetical protein